MFFQSQGNIFALPLASARLALAQDYFEQPIQTENTSESEYSADGSHWEKGPESLRRLEGFEENRTHYAAGLKTLGDYLGRNLFREGQVLEIGCSLGRKKFIAPKHAGTWTAIDYDPCVISEAKKKHADCAYATASVFQLPFAAESFDVVYSHAFLDILTDLPSAVSEISRVLKKGGFLLHLMDCNPNYKVTGMELSRRGLATFNTTIGLPRMFSMKGSDHVRVYSPSPIDFSMKDSLSDEAERSMQKYLDSENKRIGKIPEVSHALLSTALIHGALKTSGYFSKPEAGFFLAVCSREKSETPGFAVSNPYRFGRVFSTDVSPWHPQRFFAFFSLLGHAFLQRLRLRDGLEIYTSDYLIAQKFYS